MHASIAEDGNSTNVLFMIFSTFAIFWMVQGAGMFYAGLTRSKSALIQIAYSLITLSIVTIQWFLWGYSLVFSDGGSWFLGSFKFFGYKHIAGRISDVNFVPEIANSLFDAMFSVVTASLLVGCVSERGRVLPTAVFIFVWTTLVYDPIAYWTWNPNGWAARLGVLDYAGGTPVHIASGFSALAYSYVLGKRVGHGSAALNFRPHNATMVVIGTSFLWSGWIGFNCGSASYPGFQAVLALLNSQLSAAAGGLSWAYLDYRLDQRWSIVGFCSGVVSGLVCITPGAGFVAPWAALIFGIIGGLLCNVATKIKFYLNVDDALDVLAIHGIGGLVGTMLTGVFAYTGGKEGSNAGWIEGNFSAVIHQLAGCVASSSYSVLMTVVILTIMQRIPGLHIRVTADEELIGLDLSEHDEVAYVFTSDGFLSENEGEGPSNPRQSRQGLFSSVDDLNGIIDEYDFTTTEEEDDALPKTVRAIGSLGSIEQEQLEQDNYNVRPLLDRD